MYALGSSVFRCECQRLSVGGLEYLPTPIAKTPRASTMRVTSRVISLVVASDIFPHDRGVKMLAPDGPKRDEKKRQTSREVRRIKEMEMGDMEYRWRFQTRWQRRLRRHGAAFTRGIICT
jgi:hypothetical protein